MRRGIACDRQAAALAWRIASMPSAVDRLATDMTAGQFHQMQIALDDDHLGLRRNPGETKASRFPRS